MASATTALPSQASFICDLWIAGAPLLPPPGASSNWAKLSDCDKLEYACRSLLDNPNDPHLPQAAAKCSEIYKDLITSKPFKTISAADLCSTAQKIGPLLSQLPLKKPAITSFKSKLEEDPKISGQLAALKDQCPKDSTKYLDSTDSANSNWVNVWRDYVKKLPLVAIVDQVGLLNNLLGVNNPKINKAINDYVIRVLYTKNEALCEALTRLEITSLDIRTFDDAFLTAISKYLPSITHLKIHQADQLTDRKLSLLSRRLVSLTLKQYLPLGAKCQFTTEGLKNLPKGLLELNMTTTFKMTDEGLANLPRTLTQFRLEGAYYFQISDKGIKNLPKQLVVLEMTSCNEVKEWKGLPDTLQELKIAYSGMYFTALKNLPRGLLKLDLSGNKLTFIEDLPPNLTDLNLRGCNLSSCSNLPEGLIVLDLSRNTIIDKYLSDLPAGLKKLGLEGCPITGKLLAIVPRGLLSLDVAYCNNIMDSHLSGLPSQLQELNLTAAPLITDQGMKNLPNTLTALDLTACQDITDQALPILSARLTGLKHLHLKWCNLTTLLAVPPALQELDLNECHQLTGWQGDLPPTLRTLSLRMGFSFQTTSFPAGLTDLNVTNCNKLSSQTAGSFPPRITRLNVAGLDNFILTATLPWGIEHLNLSGCFYFPPEGVKNLGQYPTLRKLTFTGRKNTDSALKQLVSTTLPWVQLTPG